MAKDRLSGKLAVILHADIAGSTALVRQDEQLAHERIQDVFRRFGETIRTYRGRILELRGDALLAEFERASDAVSAALAFQAEHTYLVSRLKDDLRPAMRVGLAMGEVVIADNTVTGSGVVLAQRVEQLADPGGVCMTEALHEALPKRLPFDLENLGEQSLKGFDDPVRVYRVELRAGQSVPAPQQDDRRKATPGASKLIAAIAVMVLTVAGGVSYWIRAQAPQEEPASVARMAYPLPDEPSIAVMPFANLGNEREQEYFADGITNDLITDLSKFSNLFVIAANSTFTYKEHPVKVQQVAEDLGVRYVLEGSVQRSGDTIRINAQLIDAVSGHHLWADRYDRPADGLFAIQDEILETIVGTLQLKIKDAEIRRVLRRPTNVLKAYDYNQRGFAYMQAWGKENAALARPMYEKAIELDPQYSRAYAELAWLNAEEWRYNWIADTSESLQRALELARKAVALDPDNYWNVWTLGHVYLERGESELSIAAYERALTLNPHDPALLMEMVDLLVSIGRAEQAVDQARTAMRRNPHYPDWYLWNLGWAQYFAGQHEEAVSTLQKMTDPPNNVRRILAPALVRVGRMDEAREMISEYIENDPNQTVGDIRKLKYKHRPYVDKWAGDLLAAGLPE